MKGSIKENIKDASKYIRFTRKYFSLEVNAQ
jgi:hypothetical protein